MLNPTLIRALGAWALGLAALFLGVVSAPLGRWAEPLVEAILPGTAGHLTATATILTSLIATLPVLMIVDTYRRSTVLPVWCFAPPGLALVVLSAWHWLAMVGPTLNSGESFIPAVWHAGIWISAIALSGVIGGLVLICAPPPEGRRPLKVDKDGTAKSKWMKMRDATNNMSKPGGLILGEACIPTEDRALWGLSPILSVLPKGHLLTVASTGSGKGIGVVIVQCLAWAWGLIVHDPSCETYPTVRHHRIAMGRVVRKIAPLDDDTDGVNILDCLDPSVERTFLHDVRAVVSWLDPEENGGQPNDSSFAGLARTLCATLIMYTIGSKHILPTDKTLKKVRELGASLALKDLLLTMTQERSFTNGAMANGAAMVLGVMDSDETFAGVRMHFDALTQFIEGNESILCGDVAPEKRFHLSDILRGDTDFFICVPTDILDSTPQISRVLLGALATIFLRQNAAAKHDTLFLVDEMPRLGRLKVLETSRDVARKYSLYLWAICQDIGQLKAAYGDNGYLSWMANCGVRQFFGVNDLETAEYVSKECGTHCVFEISESTSTSTGGGSKGQTKNKTKTKHSKEVVLIAPDEVKKLATSSSGVPIEQILLLKHQDALRCGLVHYHQRPELSGLAAKNPFYKGPKTSVRVFEQVGAPLVAAMALVVMALGLLFIVPVPLRAGDTAKVTVATEVWQEDQYGRLQEIGTARPGGLIKMIIPETQAGFSEVEGQFNRRSNRALMRTNALQLVRSAQ
ncbi:MAG: type IV secretory system conjugative DNA transfer family protein [Rhodospirillaceae bacterium]